MWLSGVLLVVLVLVLQLAVTLCGMFLSGIHPLGEAVLILLAVTAIELLLGLFWVGLVLVIGLKLKSVTSSCRVYTRLA